MTREEIEAVLALEGSGSRLLVWRSGPKYWTAAIKSKDRGLWVTLLLTGGDSEEAAIRHIGIQLRDQPFPLQPLYDSQK